MPGFATSQRTFTATDTDVERLQSSLAQDMSNLLNQRRYVLIARGSGGLTFKRERSGEFLAGLILIAVGLFFLLLIEVWWLAAITLVVGALLVWTRRPATILVQLQPGQSGTDVTVEGPPERGLKELLDRHHAGIAGPR